MTPFEQAAELEALACEVIRLPGVSRRNPHAFAEAKDALARKMRRRAVELRTLPAPARAAVAAIATGTRRIDDRFVPVERRNETPRSRSLAR